MSRIISEILGHDPDRFASVINQLERAVDDHAVDVGLIGELSERSAALHRALTLDPADTTPRELYMVLRGRVRDDNQRLAGAMGGQHPDAVSEMTPLILRAIRAHVGVRECWAMKTSVAKRLLKNQPPKLTMKALGYRSIASLLKHEPISHLMAAVRAIESAEWNDALTRSYHELTAADFESRPIEIAYLDKLAYVAPLAARMSHHKLVLHSKEMGIVAIAPTHEKVIRGYTLRTATLLLHYVSEITMMSSLLKYRHTSPSYGEAVLDALVGDSLGHAQLADHPVHWRTMHRHIARSQHDLGPHMNPHDWHYETVNDGLARLVGTMVMWANAGHIAKHGPEPVSFNLIDLAIDASEGVDFDKRSLKYVRRELESELFRRYLGIPSLRTLAFRRLRIE